MRLVLHIGSTKTGSSALQWTLHARRSALLAEANALYPDRGIASSAHHLLAAAIHPGAWRLHADALPQDRAAYFEDTAAAIRADAGATGAGTIVLSSEYLWGSFPPRLYRTFREAFPDASVEIVAFLRRQDEWAISSYLQAVKSGEGRAFGEWAALNLLRETSGLHYFRIVSRWAHFLDARRVHVLRYAEARHHVYASFCERLGLPARTDFEVARVNPSPSAEGLLRLLEVNRSDASDEEKRERRREIMRTHRSDRASAETLMTPQERADMLRAGPISDRLIEETFLRDGRPLFEPLSEPVAAEGRTAP